MLRHFTVTTYIIQENKTLLLHHPKHRKWLPPGGHLETNEIPTEGAKREVLEETGLEITFILQENLWIEYQNAESLPRPFFCLLEQIPPHGNSSAHQHIDLIYVARPSGGKIKEELLQTGQLAWFTLDEVNALQIHSEIFADTKQTVNWLLTQTFTYSEDQNVSKC